MLKITFDILWDQSWYEAMKGIIGFGTYAGPKLKFAKTQAIYLNGNFDDSVDVLEWSEEPVKYLGVFMNVNVHNFENRICIKRLTKLKEL